MNNNKRYTSEPLNKNGWPDLSDTSNHNIFSDKTKNGWGPSKTESGNHNTGWGESNSLKNGFSK